MERASRDEIKREAFDEARRQSPAISQHTTVVGHVSSIGNRLLRPTPSTLDSILRSACSIPDSADLVDTVRTELGFQERAGFHAWNTASRLFDRVIPRSVKETSNHYRGVRTSRVLGKLLRLC